MVGWSSTCKPGAHLSQFSYLSEADQRCEQLKDTIDIFEFKFPDAVGVWIFDCSSNHEGFASDALNINNMNVNPGGKQAKMHSTIIPLDNPPPRPGTRDPRGETQLMVYPDDEGTPPELRSKPKGMKAVLQERGVVWDILCEKSNGKPTGTCQRCKMSQAAKDAEARVSAAEAAGCDVEGSEGSVGILESALSEPLATSDWCCMSRVLACQSDFRNEKPLIQRYVEECGHICVFLPKFHCELNPIEMVWGYAKYREPTFP
jgi:hypothetical protein